MTRNGAWDRRDLLKGSLAIGGLASLQGCAPSVRSAATMPSRAPLLVPMRMSVS